MPRGARLRGATGGQPTAVSGQGIRRKRCWLERASGVLKRQVAESRPTPGGFGREVHRALTPDARKLRRRMRRWLNANGLTIMLVFAMMTFAWMIANH
jgi:hypothetical protein